MHFIAGEAMEDHALHEGSAQSQLRLGCEPLSNTCKRPVTEKKKKKRKQKKKLFAFDLPFTCEGFI